MPAIKPLYSLRDFNYDLPEELIAQNPSSERGGSRLFILKRNPENFTHSYFEKIGDYLKDDDILVFNDARVLPARIFCRRESGGKLEIVLAEKIDSHRWKIICNRTARMKNGESFFPEKDRTIQFRITGREDEYLLIETGVELTEAVLKSIGEVPLPPYIKRAAYNSDSERYQTVYASKSGAVAAPTAGLHFTNELLDSLCARGITTVFTTLYVSWGTFSPVRENDISLHKMHSEKYILENDAAEIINSGRSKGRRIISVGTTALRVLESTYHEGRNQPGEGNTDIFIYPPYKIKSANALFTNLHTPGSTLLMLVAAFAGYDSIMNAYAEAVKERYMFFSYGDAMFII